MNPSSREHWSQNTQAPPPQPEGDSGAPPSARQMHTFGGPLPSVQSATQPPPLPQSQNQVVLPPFFPSSTAQSAHHLPALPSLAQRSSPTPRNDTSAAPSQSYSLPSISSAAAAAHSENERDYTTTTMEDIRRQAEQRDRELRHSSAVGDAHILHQPVAVPPHAQGVHGPNGILGSQGAAAAALITPGTAAIFSSAPHHQAALALQGQPQQQQVFMPFTPAPGTQANPANQAQQPILNDALSYLDQVKGQFHDQPDVYNRFLDIMKEFKSGAIDTPGVIDRVSQLFAGNPALIQGFNTFLPPGYRIECGLNDDPNAIRVTTPMGTTHSTLQARPSSPRSHANQGIPGPYSNAPQQTWTTQHHQGPHDTIPQPGPYNPGAPSNSSPDAHREHLVATMGQDARNLAVMSAAGPVMRGNMGIPANAANEIVSMANGGLSGPGGPTEKRGPVEFNHAISYVNKIKNRFASQPDIYKQFLEILQTYQRESKPIGDVYAQVTRLFDSAPDLLQDFKQFLPESAAHANAAARRQPGEDVFAMSSTRTEPGYAIAAAAATQSAHQTPRVDQQRLPPMGNFAPTPSSGKDNKRKRANDRQPPVMANMTADSIVAPGRNGSSQHASKKQKSAHIATKTSIAVPDTSAIVPSLVPPEPSPMPPASLITASNDDVQMMDKIRKHVNNKAAYTELIKLLNLYNQDAIASSYALYRLQAFIGNNAEIMNWLRNLLGDDDTDLDLVNSARPVDDRVSLSKCRTYGPSYKLLPKRERTHLCSGRDELCKSVLNDTWASHPTWDSEEAGFVAHKKTLYEETLHRIEEERHDYDSGIECLVQTISLVESINKALETKSPEERKAFRTDDKLGGQSEYIWKRTVYKLYGREHGHTVIARMKDNTHIVAPVLLGRLRDTRERWKAAQRQWNDTWRTTTLQVYHKSLDHQGTNQRATQDKRQFQPKTLQQEIKLKYESGKEARSIGLDPSLSPSSLTAREKDEYELRRTGYQFLYRFKNQKVLLDTLNLIFTQIHHKSGADDPQLAVKMRDFFALFLSMDQSQLPLATEDAQSPQSEQSLSETAAPAKNKITRKGRSLIQSVLDKDKSKNTASASASRDSTPAASAPEDDAASAAGAAEEEAAANTESEPQTWLTVRKTRAKTNSSADPAEESNEMQVDTNGVSDQTSGLVEPEEVDRTVFHMYSNSTLYCFMRLFGMLYTRLESMYDYESQIKAIIEVQKVPKPAHKLFMIERVPSDYFDDLSPTANYYEQTLSKFESLIKGHDNVTQSELEDLLRRYYLPFGYQLYHVDKHVAQIDRLGVMMLSNDKEKVSEQLLRLYKIDRTREKATYQEEHLYQKQAMKFLSAKEKEGESSYRVTYNTKSKEMTLQIFDQASSQLEQDRMTPLERWSLYVKAFESYEPTDGVPQPYPDLHWPRAPRWEDLVGDVESEEDLASPTPYSISRVLGSAKVLGVNILHASFLIDFIPTSAVGQVRMPEPIHRVEGYATSRYLKGIANQIDAIAALEGINEDVEDLPGFTSEKLANDVAMADEEVAAGDVAEDADAAKPASPAEAVEEDAGVDEIRESVEKVPEQEATKEAAEDVQMEESAE